jgi:hypothetical protein
LLNSKHQIPSTRQIQKIKKQIKNSFGFWISLTGICLDFGAWNLEFYISAVIRRIRVNPRAIKN